EDFATMYQMLSSLSSDAISEEAFQNEYKDVANRLTLDFIEFKLLSTMAKGKQAEVAYRVDFNTRVLGVLSREMVMKLIYESKAWRIQWARTLILPELEDGNRLVFIHQVPSRGRILDREGAPMAAYEDALAVGLVPGEILPQQAALVYETLAEISKYETEELATLVESTPANWYLPIISLSRADAAPYMESLRGLSGVRIDEFRSRYYVDGGVAPHVLGYLLYIPEEELDDYLRLGYRQDERVGATGLEAVYQAELSGKHGGSLYLVDSEGKILSLIAASQPESGQSITTTIDKQLQIRLQDSLGDLRAAVVVMEIDTGRVLAMVSNPGFDPNAFDKSETQAGLLQSYFTNPDQPLFNRATQGQYPLGSIFKMISMSAALETNLYHDYSSFYCGQSYWVCDSVTLYDWTYSHGAAASGELTLVEGLMRSCNPWFYRIGEGLYQEGYEDALSQMALGFGLGNETGVEISEAAGNIPETASTCVNSAQMAIGQGEILVTPLQVAAFVSALANGGTLYRPTLVNSIKTPSGEETMSFKPDALGELPISEETRSAVLEGMRLVIEEQRGTGYWAMQGLDVPVSGKTGTAQTPTGDSHAWFTGFTRQNDPERPDIAIAVLIENGGEGSAVAAPVFRRAASLYFSDYTDPSGLMPWEAEPYQALEPTPTSTSTSDD
ncbi:MAG: penicillin-binding transpeptidase domain-containing protein, partial [Chloroflexota bacterium]|nr:penicillin-binding transpeptidase domain-containing protein [Chloroflexota bacterium]